MPQWAPVRGHPRDDRGRANRVRGVRRLTAAARAPSGRGALQGVGLLQHGLRPQEEGGGQGRRQLRFVVVLRLALRLRLVVLRRRLEQQRRVEESRRSLTGRERRHTGVPSGRAGRPDAASSVAPVASGYERALRPSLGTSIAPRRRTAWRRPLPVLLKGVPGDAARVERPRGRRGGGLAENNREGRGVSLARPAGAAAPEVAAEAAVYGAVAGGAELQPAELHQLP